MQKHILKIEVDLEEGEVHVEINGSSQLLGVAIISASQDKDTKETKGLREILLPIVEHFKKNELTID